MRSNQKIALILVGTGLTLALGFNNCGQPQFAADDESIKKALDAGGAIVINDNAPYTSSHDVLLSIENRSATEMYVTNDPTCKEGGHWEPLAASKPWKLFGSNGQAQVYVKFRESPSEDLTSSCIDDAITHDDQPPSVAVTRGLATFINTADASIEFSASDAVSGIESVSCQNEGGTPVSCTSPSKRSGMAEGGHSIQLIAKDKAGNKSLPVLVSFTVDMTRPVLSLNSTPSKITNQTAAQFQFSATDAVAGIDRYECKVGAGAYALCASPFSRTFAEGEQIVSFRAIDRAGNASNEVSYSWKVDLSAPTVTITKGPQPFSAEARSSFEFTGSDDGQPLVRYECAVDGGALAACTSPFTSSSLGQGAHSFQVVGFDSAGNRSAPALYSWVIDMTAPSVMITQAPAAFSNSLSSSFGFSASDSGSGIDRTECQIDGSGFAACNSPKAYATLAEGQHKFDVRSIDKAGNVSAVASHSWRIDVTKPLVQITSGPAEWVKVRTADFGFSGTDAGGIARFECAVDSTTYAVCASPKSYANQSETTHTFLVRAVDNAGNVSDSVSRQWRVDLTGPAITFVKAPAASFESIVPAVVEYSVVDTGIGIANITCGLNGSMAACPASASVTFSNLAPGDYRFTVVSQDKLGNPSSNEISWKVTNTIVNKTQAVRVTENNRIDVLVVIDNSGSMDTEQANMAMRFGTFLDKLNGLNWQVGIVTTDVSSNAVLKDGRLIQYKDRPGQYVVTSLMDPAVAKADFAATIQRAKSEGSGNEQGIAATYRAIKRSQDPTKAENAPNVGLFRSDAALAVVVVTDADETNPAGTQEQNKPESLVNLVKTTWPGKAFSYHSIIVKPGDTACKGINGNENFGQQYANLSALTGGVVGSVCATDYAAQLGTIGQSSVELVRSVSLDCAPVDKNGDGVKDVEVTLAKGAPAPKFTIDGSKITFEANLPAGDHSIKYACIQ